MSAKRSVRQSQHRNERDKVKSRELADTKRQMHQLQRQNAQLRRKLDKVEGAALMFTGLDASEATEVAAGGVLTPEVLDDARKRMEANYGAAHCPNGCGPLRGPISLGPKTAWVCGVCKWRRAS